MECRHEKVHWNCDCRDEYRRTGNRPIVRPRQWNRKSGSRKLRCSDTRLCEDCSSASWRKGLRTVPAQDYQFQYRTVQRHSGRRAARATMRCCATGRPRSELRIIPFHLHVRCFSCRQTGVFGPKADARSLLSLRSLRPSDKTHKFAASRERYVKKHIDLRWAGQV